MCRPCSCDRWRDDRVCFAHCWLRRQGCFQVDLPSGHTCCNWIAVLLESKIKMRLPSRTLTVSFIFLTTLAFVLSAQDKQETAPSAPILGFSAPHATTEHQLEYKFQSIPSPEKAREWHRTFTAEPHPAAVTKRWLPPTVTPLLWLYPHSGTMSFGATFTSMNGVAATRAAVPCASA